MSLALAVDPKPSLDPMTPKTDPFPRKSQPQVESAVPQTLLFAGPRIQLAEPSACWGPHLVPSATCLPTQAMVGLLVHPGQGLSPAMYQTHAQVLPSASGWPDGSRVVPTRLAASLFRAMKPS